MSGDKFLRPPGARTEKEFLSRCHAMWAMCPSDALHDIPIEQVRMGFAEIDRKKCYQWTGFLLCRSCYERCPVKWVAMELERGEYPVSGWERGDWYIPDDRI